jgi:hypothetical protein
MVELGDIFCSDLRYIEEMQEELLFIKEINNIDT